MLADGTDFSQRCFMPLLVILIVQGVSFLTSWILVNNLMLSNWGQCRHDSFDWQLLLQRNLPISNREWQIEPGR